MPYNMWYLTPQREAVTAQELIDFVAGVGDGQSAAPAEGTEKRWKRIEVTRADGSWGFDIEQTVVGKTGPGADEIGSFSEELGDAKPTANAQWVAQYLTRVRTIYLFRCSNGWSETSDFKLVNDILNSFRHDEPYGLLYAEGEGWSNENGQHLTWGFSDRVTGEWWMALSEEDGWRYFRMDLGNRDHRKAFKAGKVPDGLESKFYTD